jgi:diguanylate cyclase (GGDEF)-like protein/PAS domain S-box-containing protein
MNWNCFQWRSLKTRVTLFTLAISLFSFWSLAFYSSRMLREDMRRQLGEQQFSTVSLLASHVNEQLELRLTALISVAGEITPAILEDSAALQTLLEQRPVLQLLFNGGTIALGPDGTTIADVPLSAGRIGANYMDRAHVATALKEGKSGIGRPVNSRELTAPVISTVVPIRDAQNRVIGALVGTTDLSKPNFLDKITGSNYGKSGGYVLIAPQHGLTVTATDRSLIMRPNPAPGVNPLFDRYVQGFEGYGGTVDSRGLEVLSSAKQIPVAGWLLVGRISAEEAFAPIRAMQQRMLLAAILLTLLAAGLTGWITLRMLRRQFLPMIAATKALTNLSETNQLPHLLSATTQDEIGDLIAGFNRLLETLRQRELDFRSLVNNVPDFVMRYDRQHRHIFANDGCLRAVGMTWDEFIGKTHRELGFPEDLCSLWESAIDRCFETQEPQSAIFNWDSANGPVVLEWRAIPEVNEDGSLKTVLGLSRDVTERTRLENEVREAALHDALTKLPNRRLLNDRLGQAMASSKRSGCYGAMMFLDLDNFKQINDMHGHEVGDLLLIQVADRLKSCVREMDTVARFGGDEFVVMISELDADGSESATQAAIIAEKLRAALDKSYVLQVRHEGTAEETVEHYCTASIGVVLFGPHEVSQDDILKWADMAMYKAKEEGCNLIRFHDSKAGVTA